MAKENFSSGEITVEVEAIRLIREMMLIGLASFGEIERLIDRQRFRESMGESVPDDDKVIHATGCSDTVVNFADALRVLDSLETKVRLTARKQARNIA
ncbi:MAG: hypothetical protein ABI583_03940 [Betaproteobacteria bacterium]